MPLFLRVAIHNELLGENVMIFLLLMRPYKSCYLFL